MDKQETRLLLEKVAAGELKVEEAVLRLKMEPFKDLGYAKVDHHRGIRQGVAEVIYGAGKTPEQIAGIVSAMKENGQRRVLITRLSQEAARIVGQSHGRGGACILSG